MPSYKIIQSGHINELYIYEGACSLIREEDKIGRSGGRDKEGKEERKEEYRNSVNYKAREKIRRLVLANFNENSLFITLTYKENMQDIEQANYDFKKFIQKLKRKQSNFRYVAVIEFQKRGAIHYHMICNFNLKWNSQEELRQQERIMGKIWGNGFVDITDIKGLDNVGSYLIKYMSKNGYDERLEGKKRYFFLVPSNNLND